MMTKDEMRGLVLDRLFRAGILAQAVAAVLFASVVISIRFGWIDIVSLGLQTPPDEPSRRLDALYYGADVLIAVWAVGLGACVVAFWRQNRKTKAQQAVARYASQVRQP